MPQSPQFCSHETALTIPALCGLQCPWSCLDPSRTLASTTSYPSSPLGQPLPPSRGSSHPHDAIPVWATPCPVPAGESRGGAGRGPCVHSLPAWLCTVPWLPPCVLSCPPPATTPTRGPSPKGRGLAVCGVQAASQCLYNGELTFPADEFMRFLKVCNSSYRIPSSLPRFCSWRFPFLGENAPPPRPPHPPAVHVRPHTCRQRTQSGRSGHSDK